MKELDYEQKIAVLRILMDIVLADGFVDERERMFFNLISGKLGLEESARVDMQRKNSLLALLDVKNFTLEQKDGFALLMGQMIVVDENIHFNEVRIYNVVRDFCEIQKSFDEKEYPFYNNKNQ